MKNQRKMVRISSGEFWTPDEKGQTFSGEITNRRIIETKYGLRPVTEFTDKATGESVELITNNMRLRGLNRVPLGTFVTLEYDGDETVMIGRKKQLVALIHASIPAGTKRVEDWTQGKLEAPAKSVAKKAVSKTKGGKR